MTHYVITVELDAPFTEDAADWILEELQDWHVVAIGHPSGNIGATFTLPATSLAEAVATAYERLRATHGVVEMSVVDEGTRDHREGFPIGATR